MKRLLLSVSSIFLVATLLPAQNLLNKIKSKAQQEVNKLENGAIKNSQSGKNNQPNKNKLSSNVTRTVVVSLGSNESFDYQENCIDLGTSLSQVSFIVTKRVGNSVQCFSYKNGIKTPVPCPTVVNGNNNCQTSLQCSYYQLRELNPISDDIKKYVTDQTENHNAQQPTISDQQLKTMQAYMTAEQIEQMKKQMAEAQKQTAGQTYSTITARTINFNGKSYGPYKNIGKFYLTPDNNNFYAIVGEAKPGNAYLSQNKMITSTSNTILTLADNITASSCIASADNSEFGYISYDISSQKNVIITSSNKKIEIPLNAEVWYSNSGNHIISLAQSQLLFDQNSIKTFSPNEYVKPCDLYVSSDGKGVSVVKNNTLSFGDGDYYEYPLKIVLVNEGGKNYFKWLALENQEVVVYQKPN